MMEQILAWIKLPKDLAWPIVIVSALLLWGPDAFKDGLGLNLFIAEYRKWIGVVFLFFLVVGLLPVVPFFVRLVKDKHKINQQILWSKNRLKDLTSGEKEILKYYIVNNTRSQDLDIQNGEVSKLISDGFLYPASNMSYGDRRGSFTFPININDWTWDYLRKERELLD